MLQNTLTRLRKAREDEGGFTLIELLIVILILGVLAGIVVFSVRGITDRGNSAACRTSVNTVDTAFEALVAKSTGALPTAAGTTVASLVPDYLHKAPTKIGSTDITAATTVADVDAIVCPS